MASSIDTTKTRKAMDKLVEKQRAERIIVAGFKYAFQRGVLENFASLEPNAPSTIDWKRKRGMQLKPLVAKGNLLKAVSNNPPTKLGTKNKLKVGYNRRSAVGFATPTSFRDYSSGRFLPAKGTRSQEVVRGVLVRGSATNRIASNARRAGRSLQGDLDNAIGPSRQARQRAVAGGKGVPARPFMVWRQGWYKQMVQDIDVAMKTNLKEVGL
jgi:hypothetical protein